MVDGDYIARRPVSGAKPRETRPPRRRASARWWRRSRQFPGGHALESWTKTIFWRLEGGSGVRENTDGSGRTEGVRSYLDVLRPLLGVAFLIGYAWQTFAPDSFGTEIFLGVGAVLFVISVPWSSAFHRAFALVAFVALCAVIFTGRFDFAD